MAPGRFDGQNWVVVGGSEGVGPAVVLLAAQRGATVLWSGRPGSGEAAGVLDSARAAGVAERVLLVAADPSLPEEVERLFDQALERFFDLHVLVVNGTGQAALPPGRPLAETSLEEWNQTLAVQVRGPFLVVQRALQEFLAGGKGGRIVFVAPATVKGAGQAVVHSALCSLVRSIAKEYGRRGIACNALLAPTGPAQAEAVAETVLFLASSEASFVNGEVLVSPWPWGRQQNALGF